MHKGDFWGLFGIRLGRCPCIIPEKISFLQFYSRFNPNALALMWAVMYVIFPANNNIFAAINKISESVNELIYESMRWTNKRAREERINE